MITIDALTKDFGDFTAVDGITFSVAPGEVLGFLGPNGAGKSTTMKMLTGFIRPTAGCITICGHDIQADPVVAKTLIGYLPEGAPAYGEMTVEHFLRFVGELRGLSGEELSDRIDHVAELLALNAVSHQTIGSLSKGFKRRVGIAQAILHDPKVLILDEPTDGLDPNQKHQVRQLIKGLAEDKIVIVSTHILEEVSAVCSRVIIMAHGRLLADTTPAELATRSRYFKAVSIRVSDVETSEIQEALASLKGLSEIETDQADRGHYTLIPDRGHNLLSDITGLIQRHSWRVEEIFMEQGRLDDVFRTLTTGGAVSGASGERTGEGQQP